MSVGAREERRDTGPMPAVGQPETGARDTPGLLFARLTALPLLLVTPFLLTSFPLLLLGWFKPVPVIAAWVVLAAIMVPWGWRRVPTIAGTLAWGGRPEGGARTPWWPLIALAVVSVAFGVDSAIFHSQYIIVMTDPASYMQFAYWIAHHGTVVIPANQAAFGGAPGIVYPSPAFYQVGNHLVPQFMAGLPMILSAGIWAGGIKTALFFGPLLGAAAVFTFGGLAARLIGPRWGWVAALVIAVCLPQEFTSRSTYSEPLAQILFLGALALWVDSQRTASAPEEQPRWWRNWGTDWRRPTHVLALLAGLGLGINLLVRVDGPSDMLLAVPFGGMLVLQRRRQAVPFAVGMVIGLAYGAVDGVVLSWPYLQTNMESVKPLTEVFIAAVICTAIAVAVFRWRGRGLPTLPPRLTDIAVVLPPLVLAGFWCRAYVEKPWAPKYAPLSLHWVYWYTGIGIIAFAAIAAGLLLRQCLRGRAPLWILPLLLFSWTVAEFLFRPAIVPHQPFASRRMVPGVLPALVLLSVWLMAALVRWARVSEFSVPRVLRRVPLIGVTAISGLVLLVPPIQTTFGFGIAHGGSKGVHLVSNGLAFQRTYLGELVAMDDVCRAIPANSSVLILDLGTARSFTQDIRAMCGVPTAYANIKTRAGLTADIAAIERAGRHPVILSATNKEMAPIRDLGTVKRIMALYTAIDQRQILSAPHGVDPVVMVIYRWEPRSNGG